MTSSAVDFDLHGFVGIRLLDATPGDVAAVNRQLGPIQSSFDRNPDIVLRFVDQLETSSPLRYLDLDDVAFTDNAFLILKGKHKSRTKVQIPFERIGDGCEIVCERGLAAVPLLIDIVNATALGNGFLPLHASAFNFNGIGFLATGWSKGGKSETLLGFMANGAEYVGDEWVYLSEDGQRMYGIPEPIRVWDWHLDYLPRYRALLSSRRRTKLRVLKALSGGAGSNGTHGKSKRGASATVIKRLGPLLKRQMHVDWPPEKLFGRGALAMAGNLDKVIFVVSHESADVLVEPIDPLLVARRMCFSLLEERDDFMSYYRKFRFAFPDLQNDLLERTPEIQTSHLSRAFAGKDAYVVYHPYPVNIPDVFEAVSQIGIEKPACSLLH